MFYIEIFLIFLFVSIKCVIGDLGLSEGASCTTDGVNGTCYNIYKCPSAALTYIYVNSGYSDNLPPLPEVCSFDDEDPVVCCTDCSIDETQVHRNYGLLPGGIPVKKDGPVAWKKCLEHFQRLPYPCRGHGNYEVNKIWNAAKKCHEVSQELTSPVGGRTAERWEFPHMASLTRVWREPGLGTMVLWGLSHQGPIKYAALGLLKRTDPKKLWRIYDVKRIIKHPEYKSPVKYHDIALLETVTEINFGRTILPICLDTGKISRSSTVIEAAGWGRLGHRKDLADNLEVVNLEEFKESECANIYGPYRLLLTGYNHTTQMCYGSHKKIIDTCEGDSGGPLQINNSKCLYSIIGVTSYGQDCGILGSAGMYTRVIHYVPWIESVVWPDEVSETIVKPTNTA